MTTRVAELSHLLKTITYWTVREDGWFDAWRYDRTANDYFLEQTFSSKDLATVHPKLPLTFGAQIHWETETTGRNDVRININTVEKLLAMLRAQTITVEDWDGNTRLFEKLNQVEIPFDSKTLVHLHGVELFTQTIQFAGEAAVVLKATSLPTVVITRRRFLNQRYPGWSERLLVGTQLGIEQAALMSHVFPQVPTSYPAAIAISNIQFE